MHVFRNYWHTFLLIALYSVTAWKNWVLGKLLVLVSFDLVLIK